MFDFRQVSSVLLGLATISIVATGCDSGKTDGGGPSGKEDQFVSNESTTGSIGLSISNTSFSVGNTSGFFATVRDSNGAPVSGIRIACDTEQGLALIEPTTGFEITDGFGNVSGVVGCERPGSYQMACRLPVGGNKREFGSVICTGDIPSGFTGFPGAGGGGLGGGSDPSANDGTSTAVISGVNFYDGGSLSSSSSSVDITQGLCDDGSGEPFFDTSVGFNITNNTKDTITITSYRYTVSNFDGAGGSHTSPSLSLNNQVMVDANGGSSEVFALLLDANGSGKRFFGRTENISSEGFRNFSFRVSGTTGNGDSITLTAGNSASLGTFDRCS